MTFLIIIRVKGYGALRRNYSAKLDSYSRLITLANEKAPKLSGENFLRWISNAIRLSCHIRSKMSLFAAVAGTVVLKALPKLVGVVFAVVWNIMPACCCCCEDVVNDVSSPNVGCCCTPVWYSWFRLMFPV